MFWILLGVGLSIFLYLLLVRRLKFWSNRGVPQYDLKKIWIDTFKDLLQLRPAAEEFREMYNSFQNDRYAGVYQFLMPAIILRDPDLIKQTCVKDADHFLDHFSFVPADTEPLWEKNLFALKGDKWREMRATLSPSFTSSKMKAMFALMSQCAEQFISYFEKKDEPIITLEMKNVFARFTNDVIASTAFGVTCDSLKDPENEFYLTGKEAAKFGGSRIIVLLAAPKLAKWLGIRLFKEKLRNFFKKLITDSIAIRERENIVRPDMIHLLMEARKGKEKHEHHSKVVDAGFAAIDETFTQTEEKPPRQPLTDDDITSQAFVFFLAGFDTVSSAMSFTAYELAVNPDVQERLQREIDDTLSECSGSITYEALMKMKYLDMVISESLRKWPPSFASDRICVKPYTIHPQKDDEKPFHFQTGEAFLIPTYGIHRDPSHYPDPERFDPERFSDENKSNIKPYTYMPFGVGARSCIGSRFALMEIKLLFFHFLSKFTITVVEKTTVPLQLENSPVTLTSKGGFWLGLKARNIK